MSAAIMMNPIPAISVAASVPSGVAFGRSVMHALEGGPATPQTLANDTGVSELIIRSVLQALVAVDCLHYDRRRGTYALWCDLP